MLPTPLSKVVDYRAPRLLSKRQMILQLDAFCIHESKDRIVNLCTIKKNCTRQNPTALMLFLANGKNRLDNCGECKNDAVRE